MLKDIYKRLGIETDIEKEKGKFYRRIMMSVELVIEPLNDMENWSTYVDIRESLEFKLITLVAFGGWVWFCFFLRDTIGWPGMMK